MPIEINWTTVFATAIASAVTAVVVGITQFVVMRYFTRAWEKIEKLGKTEEPKTEKRK